MLGKLKWFMKMFILELKNGMENQGLKKDKILNMQLLIEKRNFLIKLRYQKKHKVLKKY